MFRKKLRELLRLNKKNRISTKDKIELIIKLLDFESPESLRHTDRLEKHYKRAIDLLSQ